MFIVDVAKTSSFNGKNFFFSFPFGKWLPDFWSLWICARNFCDSKEENEEKDEEEEYEEKCN